MTNIYILTYQYKLFDSSTFVFTFTKKQLAIETARYYRDTIHCEYVTLRQDKQCHSGWCDIKGFIDF